MMKLTRHTLNPSRYGLAAVSAVLLLAACAKRPEPLDKSGLKDPDLFDTSIRNLAPEPSLKAPSHLDEGQEMLVEVDANDVDSKKITYLFDWDGNGVFDDIQEKSQGRHVYNQDGVYRVVVRVQDDSGNSAEVATTVNVKDLKPTAAFKVPNSILEGAWATFDASTSTSPTDALVKYEWDWNYDGRNFKGSSAQGQRVENRWLRDGDYVAALRITDSDGSQDIAQQSIRVEDQGPQARISGPKTLMTGQTAVFSALDSTTVVDPIQSYWWDTKFDGTFQASNKQSRKQISLRWNKPGSYVIAVQVTDSDGSVAQSTHQIEVSAPQPKETKKGKG